MTARIRVGDVRVGDELPPSARTVTRGDVAAYAEASGDRNPLHLDDAFARAAGFPGVIAHGMLTMGHLASALVAWSGDAGALKRLRTPFRAVVHIGDTIVAGGRVTSVDPESRRATLEVWVSVERDGDTEFPIRRGRAEVELAPS
jgi:acyl dehydratase